MNLTHWLSRRWTNVRRRFNFGSRMWWTFNDCLPIAISLFFNGLGDPLCWPRDALYPLKLALTWPTSGGRSVGTFRLRTTGHGVSFYLPSLDMRISTKFLDESQLGRGTLITYSYLFLWRLINSRLWKWICTFPGLQWMHWYSCSVNSIRNSSKSEMFIVLNLQLIWTLK
jgi:hypothetical protein